MMFHKKMLEHLQIKISIWAGVLFLIFVGAFFSVFIIGKIKENEPELYVFSPELLEKFHEESQKIKLLVVGDMMLGRNVGGLIEKYPQSPIYPFAEISSVFQDNDVVLGNLEGPITDKGREVNTDTCILFKFATSTAADLSKAGMDIVSLANNHTYNQGEAGFIDTQNFLEEANVASFGSQVEENDESVVVMQVKNRKIAFIGVNTVGRTVDMENINNLILQAKQNADLVIMYIHWGNEYEEKESGVQKKLAYLLIDAGVDVILGSHPHVMQPLEIYKNKPIFYSLGNFVFDQYFSQETQQGLMVKISWLEDKKEFSLLPVKIDKSEPQLMDKEDKQKILNSLAGLSDVSDEFKEQIRGGKIVLNN